MLTNYLKIAYRHLLRHKAFSLISILGLAVGMAACLLIAHYVRFERSYESFHQHADQIYRVTLDLYKGSEYVVTDCETYGPLGPLLAEQMPEVRNFVRMYHQENLEMEANAHRFREDKVYFADSSVFDVFTYEVLSGDASTALTKPFQAVLTASMAHKYFGHTDVVGEAIEVANQRYGITAVIADVPPNTHLKFDLLLSHVSINQMWSWYEQYAWGGNNEYTYLLMAPGTDLAAFNQKLVELSTSLDDKLDGDVFTAELIGGIHLYSDKTFEPEVNGSAQTVYLLLIIALLIVIIAWVNYINLSTARAVERAREVGVRKVMGSDRKQLVGQFLLEATLISFIATAVALLLVQISLPIFRDVTGQPLSLNIMSDSSFWVLLFGLLATGALLAGLYPALVLSSFQPTVVLKGRLRTSSHGQWLRQGMVVFQFVATMVLIVGTCTVYLQIQHLREQRLGMDISQTLALHAPSLDTPDSLYAAQWQSFRTELLRLPAVQQATSSESLPGLSLHELSTSTGITPVGENDKGGYNYYVIRADAHFIPTMDMKLVAGRNFEPGSASYGQVIVNEEAVRMLGFADAEAAVGSQITYYRDEEPTTIIGVLQNYHQRSPKEAHIPMVFPYTEAGSYLSLRLDTHQLRETLAAVESVWQRVYPNSALDYFFLDDTYDQQYRADTRFGQVVAIFSVLAVFIACLGLLGLSSFTVLQRTGEISVRKVLGASVGQIVLLLSRDFVRLVAVSCLVAVPLAYFAMQAWLEGYATRINLTGWLFLLPLTVILAMTILTVSSQTIRAALANPANSLRNE